MNSLTKRQKKLVNLLVSESDYKTIEFYSKKMGVSERTVHNDLGNIKLFLHDQNIVLQKKPGSGIKLNANQDEKILIINGVNENKENFDPLSIEMRRINIFSKLFYSQQTLSLQKLSEEYMVSKTSIVKDLDKIEEWINQFGIKLVRDREGTRIVGNEIAIRNAIANIVTNLLAIDFKEEDKEQGIKSRLDRSSYLGLSKMFDKQEITTVETMIAKAEKKLKYKISEPYYTNLLTHILILLKRVRSGNQLYANKRQVKIGEHLSTETYLIAESMARQISEEFQIEVIQSEIIYINQYLMSSGVEKEMLINNTQQFIDNVDDHIKNLVDELISLSSKTSNIDLSNDQELYLGLLMHFKPMVNRLKYSIKINNPLLEEIKSEYSATFGLTWLVCSNLETRYGLKVNEDEIGYIALHFQAAFERLVTAKKVIVVCPGGMGTSQLIANRIKRYVPQVEVKEVVSISHIEKINTDDIDFIISTVPLEIDAKPVIVISSLVSKTDIKNINNFFSDFLFTTHNKKISCSNLVKVVDKDLIYTELDFDNKQDILDFLCEQLEKRGYVNSEFKESLLKRENIAPTSLGNCVAIPHGGYENVNTPKVVIAVLNNDVNWGKDPVKIIFLIAMNFKEDVSVKHVLSDLYQVFDSESMLEEIANCNNADQVFQLIRSGEYGH
ncbi:BglG family transcription antiterminator [Alkalihalobacillus sp. MEB130]|uniref:BglG family transcription antiterminator n=1 Tax=Alkalihalobacillus sp. MEB130 TaxID=2976704 RepID=UPI0028E00A9A|nr:BglG family transcription antiterminator [Alkalihalobacillus sp. MEB130]MDT8861808.1 BglG family transcription antiterminator [Alkalihalobacillus sp. MEB130]